jgi:methionine-rich copper-binding protein CopC
MKKSRILSFAAALALFSGIVHAHTHLEKAMPADNSVLASSPSELMLHFSEATRLTALSIQKEGESESTNISALPKDSSQALTIPLNPLAPGKYLVKWRALGADKHVMSGTLHFTVTGK